MTPQGRGASARAQAARVSALVAPVVRDAGFDLEKVTVKRIGRRHVVRLVIDGDHGVDLESAAAVSRSVSTALDEAEAAGQTLFPGEYVLEVSSPGTDRPLTEPKHWRRNVGRLVTVPVREADGERVLTGRVVAADGSEVTLEVDGEPRRLPLSALGAGRVQVELRRLEEMPGEDELDEVPGGEEEGGSR
ncbi:MAG: ribosome maturation factor RimP [Micromonosporaceae bacterium]|jgi:ribosome maturation factor RimP